MNYDRLKAQLTFYPTLWWNMLLGRVLNVRNWWDPINENIVLGALPFASDVKKLRDIGVGAVVNTCQEYEGPIEEYRRHNIVQMRMPTVDFTQPKLEDVKQAVQFIEKQIADGRRVYVHCKAGRARSATVVLCWLIKAKQMTANKAEALLLEKRPHVNRHLAERTVARDFEKEYLV